MEQVRETAGLTLRAILRYVRAKADDATVGRVLALAGECEESQVYDDPRRWWSYETKIRVFEAAAEVLGDETVGYQVGRTILAYSVNTPLRLGLLLLGGPAQLIRLIATTSAKFNAAADMSTLRTARGSATVQYRLRSGYRPSRFDCDYTRGLLTQLPALFGLPPATVGHDVCQVRGAEACVYTIRWRHRSLLPWRRRQSGDSSGEVVAGRIELLQRTVAELVAAQHPDKALALVADRAGFAVNAQAFLLVARPMPDQPRQVHGYGLAEEEIARLTETAPAGEAGTLVVDIVSPIRYYGYLVAYCDDFLDTERRMLDAYANLAAVTLDALGAIDTAAERQRTAESMLALARSLTQARTAEHVARVTVEATSTVMRADAAVLMLIADGSLRVAASFGFTDKAKARGFAVTRSDTALFDRFAGNLGQARVYDRDSEDPFIRQALQDFGFTAAAVVTVALPDRPYGILISTFAGGQPAVRGQEFLARMSGIADQAATALRNCELLEQTWRLAHVDPLTGLANRRAFLAELEAALSTGDGALLYLDLDGFKQVNDSLGHAAGDELLAAVAGRLAGCTRTGDLVARLGGDEFVVLTHGALGIDGLPELAERIRRVFTVPVSVRDGEAVQVHASVGGTRFRAGETTEAVLHRADTAMYDAKRTHGAQPVPR